LIALAISTTPARVLALAILASAGGEAAAAQGDLALDLDPCAQVDEAVVQNLVELELRDARARRASVAISVAVRCIDGAQEIRVEPWASRGEDGIRTIALPDAEDATATLEARSRELALAIAELIRRLEITRPLPAPPPPPPPPPVVIAPPPEPSRRWTLGVLSSFDYFTGGQWLAGADLAMTRSLGRWAVGDVRLGGRFADGQTLPSGHLTVRAGTVGLGGGVAAWSRQRAVGLALMLRAQGYGVEYGAELPADGGARTARLGAFVVALEPRLLVAVTRRISIAAGGAAGVPVHGIVVRTQGVETDSLSGLFVSANLALVVAL
jgi:hypothetical protein